MAFVGLRYAVFAPEKSHTEGQPIVYDPGIVMAKMVSADITMTRNSEGLYADDALAESDNSITGGTISLTLDDVLPEAQVAVFGVKKSGEGESAIYRETGKSTPYGGFGYIRERRHQGKTQFVGYWLHRVQLAITNETANTRTGTTTYQTPTVSGNIMGVKLDSDGENYFRDYKVADTVEAVKTWIDGLANLKA